MSSSPSEDQQPKFVEADADFGAAAVSASTSGSGSDSVTGGSGSASTSASGSASGSAGSSSTNSKSRSTASDSRRVAPKWLGKKVGRFRLQGLLGQGAVGRVFRAEDAILHRRVALKVIVIHTDDGQINRNADTFLTEARAAAALEHPSVVQIYEAGETGNLCYIAMELLDGGSLKDLVAASGAMDPGRACLLTADAAEALAAAHEAGIIHRDVKPANLMLTRQGRCKVTDFGLATFGEADSVSRERAAGTPLFAAPEVIRGTSADEQSDVYSLGATLFYLLSGRPPFTGKSRSEVLRKHVNEPVPDLRALRPGLPESLVAAVERALDKDPGQRFPSALQFARVLRVQTIPAAPLPNMLPGMTSAGDSIGGASVLNLSGMTAVTGSTGNLQAGSGGGGGLLTANDLLWLPTVKSEASPEPAPPAPLVVRVPTTNVDDATPPAGRRRPRVRVAALGIAVAAVVVVLGVVAIAFGLRAGHPAWAVSAPVVAPSPAPSATGTPKPAPRLAPLVAPVTFDPPGAARAVPGPAKVATPGAPSVVAPPVAVPPGALAPTDIEQLTRIANGADPDHVDMQATVVGTVSRTTLSPTGKTVRVIFVHSQFALVYFDEGNLYARMAQRFGVNASRLPGKNIRVTGRIKMYGKFPEIIVSSPSQVTVLDPPPTQ